MNYSWKWLCITAAFVSATLFIGCAGKGESGPTGILVSTEWLQNHLNDPDLVVLHSGSVELFDSLHIPGARLITPASFTVNTDPNRNEMPPADSIVDLLREVGVNNDSKIVLYHEDIGLLNRTARVFVTLDHLGLGEQTVVLDGGLPAWLEDDCEANGVLADFSAGNFEIDELKEVFITAAELDQLRWNDMHVLIDARSDEEYYGTPGTNEYPEEGGHIEGAYALSYLKITTDDSPYLFLPENEMEELFRRAGMDPGKVTLIYCNSGIKGSLNYLAARQLGYPAKLYDGSYEEWEELSMPVIGPVEIPDEID